MDKQYWQREPNRLQSYAHEDKNVNKIYIKFMHILHILKIKITLYELIP